MSVLSPVSKQSVRRLFFFLAVGLILPASGVAQTTPQAPVPDSAFADVDSLRAGGDFQSALVHLQDLRTRHGDHAEILSRMSLLKVDSAKTSDDDQRVKTLYQDALSLADDALAADSTVARAHHAKAVAEGRIALDAGRQERVRRSRTVKHHADRAIALDSTLDEPYHVRARWHREVADLGFLEKVVVKTVYGGLPDASIDQSVRDFKRAIALEDKRFHHLELARTYMQMDREEDAKEELRDLLELPPQGPFDRKYGLQAQQFLDSLE